MRVPVLALALLFAMAGAWTDVQAAPRASAGARDPEVRLPPGTRADASGQLVSSRGIRDTTDFLAKELSRRGIAVRQIGPYRVRGAEVTRFVSTTASTAWLAIHVLRKEGKTLIFFVPRART